MMNDPIDQVLAWGTVFDWITPTAALVLDLLCGPTVTIMLPHDGSWSGKELTDLLNDHGVPTWGHMIVNDTLMFTFEERFWPWAYWLLCHYGVFADDPPEPEWEDETGEMLEEEVLLWV